MLRALSNQDWQRLDPVRKAETGGDEHSREARNIVRRLREGVTNNEIVQSLPKILHTAENETFEWLKRIIGPSPTPPSPPDPGPGPEVVDQIILRSQSDLKTVEQELQIFLKKHNGKRVHVKWWVE
jgi:hypothetical protein